MLTHMAIERLSAELHRTMGPPRYGEDAIQDVLVKVLTKADTLTSEDDAIGWCRHALYQGWIDRVRHAEHVKVYAVGPIESAHLPTQEAYVAVSEVIDSLGVDAVVNIINGQQTWETKYALRKVRGH